MTTTDAATTNGRGGLVLIAAGVCATLACVVALVVAVSGATATPGAEARAGSFDFVVHRVETTDVLADPEYPERNITAAGKFVVVKLTATNISGVRQTFRTVFDSVSDGMTEYGVDQEARRYVGPVTKDVEPGKSIDAAVVFDVPRAVDLEAIVLRDRRFAQGVAVAL